MLARTSLLIALFAAACVDPAPADDDSVADPGPEQIPAVPGPGFPWVREFPDPADWAPLPACTRWEHGLTMPEIGEPWGLIRPLVDAPIQPVGLDLRIPIEVRLVGSGEVETGFAGGVSVAVDPPTAEVTLEPPVAGVAWLTLRLPSAGSYTLSLGTTSDGRTGGAEILAYDVQLPLWELQVKDADWDSMFVDPFASIEVPATLSIDGSPALPGVLRLHGASSRDMRKSSFRFKLDGDERFSWGGRTVILRAEWVDKTMIRNHLGLELINQGTWLPVSHSEFVHLRRNGAFVGLQLAAERVDGSFVEARGLDTRGNLYEADPPQALTPPGANLTPLPSPADYPLAYDAQLGGGHEDLRAFIEWTLQADPAVIAVLLEEAVAVEDVLVLLAAWALIQDQDHIRKNYALFHAEASADPRWVMFPWDLDLTFGHVWTEENDIFDEGIVVDGALDAGVRVPEHDYYNALVDRVLSVPSYRATWEDDVRALMDGVFSPEFVLPWVEGQIDCMAPEILTDSHKRAENDEYAARVQEIYDFVDARRAFALTWLP